MKLVAYELKENRANIDEIFTLYDAPRPILFGYIWKEYKYWLNYFLNCLNREGSCLVLVRAFEACCKMQINAIHCI